MPRPAIVQQRRWRPTGTGPQRQRQPAMPTAITAKPRCTSQRGRGARRPLLHPGAGGPRQRGAGEGQAGDPGRGVVASVTASDT